LSAVSIFSVNQGPYREEGWGGQSERDKEWETEWRVEEDRRGWYRNKDDCQNPISGVVTDGCLAHLLGKNVTGTLQWLRDQTERQHGWKEDSMLVKRIAACTHLSSTVYEL